MCSPSLLVSHLIFSINVDVNVFTGRAMYDMYVQHITPTSTCTLIPKHTYTNLSHTLLQQNISSHVYKLLHIFTHIIHTFLNTQSHTLIYTYECIQAQVYVHIPTHSHVRIQHNEKTHTQQSCLQVHTQPYEEEIRKYLFDS